MQKNDKRTYHICTYAILSFVSLIMTVLNILTNKGMLTVWTGLFAAFCLVDIFLTQRSNRLSTLATILFTAKIISMFTYFLISGQPEGFSAMWIIFLPMAGLFFFGRRTGSVICTIMFTILIFLLWSPQGRDLLLYPYTTSFKMRFPLLYFGAYLLSFFLATIKDKAFERVEEEQEKYRRLSSHDYLTGLLNRSGLYASVEENFPPSGHMGAVIMDLDYFKSVNDVFGHDAGDTTLRIVADQMKRYFGEQICRWGGEEFVVLYRDKEVTRERLEMFRRSVESAEYPFTGHRITVSLGVYEGDYDSLDKVDEFIGHADDALYLAKLNGRNRVEFSGTPMP